MFINISFISVLLLTEKMLQQIMNQAAIKAKKKGKSVTIQNKGKAIQDVTLIHRCDEQVQTHIPFSVCLSIDTSLSSSSSSSSTSSKSLSSTDSGSDDEILDPSDPRANLPSHLRSLPIIEDDDLDELQAKGIPVVELKIDAEGNVQEFTERKVGAKTIKELLTSKTLRNDDDTTSKNSNSEIASDDSDDEFDDSTASPHLNHAAILRAVESLKKTLSSAQGDTAAINKNNLKGLFDNGFQIETVQAFTLGEDGETR